MLESKKESSAVNDLNRGGQVLMHFLRMLHQTLARYAKAVIFVFISMTVLFTYKMTNETDWYMGIKYAYSYSVVTYVGWERGTTKLKLPNGREVEVTDKQIANSGVMQNHAISLAENIVKASLLSTAVALFFAWLLYRFLRRKGREERNDEYIRGAKLATKRELIDAVKEKIKTERNPSRISIGGVPLLPEQENSGIALIGSPGVGKSTTYRDVLTQLRKQKKKCVLYDIGGEFTKHFYRPGTDVILNVFDKRSAQWDFWCEGKNPATYDKMAKAAIPDAKGGGDPFWTIAPQLFFSALLEELGNRFAVPKVDHLMNIILKMSNENIAKVVATTDARNIINLDVDKLAQSVRAVSTAYTRNFKYFSLMKGQRFSFKDWARNEDSDAWVFITVRDDMKETLKPMLTMLVEAALTSILTLEADEQRLIGVILDEFGTLHEIPSFSNFISTCRKYGGMPVIGFQSNSQVDDIYGDTTAKVLMDSMGALAAFRINGSDGSEWLARQLGDQEKEEAIENLSFGANEVRDATNVNRNNKESNLILRSQIGELDNRHFFLRLGRGLPVAKVESPYVKMPVLHSAIDEVDYFTDDSKQRLFTNENELTPEAIVAAMSRNNVAKEQSRFNPKNSPQDAIAQTMDDVFDQVIGSSSRQQQKAQDVDSYAPPSEAIPTGENPSADDTAPSGDANDTSDFIDDFSTVDLSALASEREAGAQPQQDKTQHDNSQPSVDIFSGFKFP